MKYYGIDVEQELWEIFNMEVGRELIHQEFPEATEDQIEEILPLCKEAGANAIPLYYLKFCAKDW